MEYIQSFNVVFPSDYVLDIVLFSVGELSSCYYYAAEICMFLHRVHCDVIDIDVINDGRCRFI